MKFFKSKLNYHFLEQLKSVHEDEKPIVKASSRTVTVEPKISAQLRFSVVGGKPEPVISWYRQLENGEEKKIIPSQKYEVNFLFIYLGLSQFWNILKIPY